MQKPSACIEEMCKARGKFGKAGRHNVVCATKYSMHSNTVHRTHTHNVLQEVEPHCFKAVAKGSETESF